jgi:tetratricopeptide (TPR) repeat protein
MRVCLNMIVKNERAVIGRCLDSVRSFVDTWVIVDTGSTDGTQAFIREKLQGVPGELFERPWVNFGRNRTEAMELARDRADFLLLLDADEIIEHASLELDSLKADEYLANLQLGDSDTTWYRPALVRSRLPWRYQGVVHEYLTCDLPHTRDRLPGLKLRSFSDGARNRVPAAKYAADAKLLEAALLESPDDCRYSFYLAQSLRDSGDPEAALPAYERRIALGGWEEEVFEAKYQIGRLKEQLGRPWPEIVTAYLDAFEYRRSRAEPLYALARLNRLRSNWAQAELFARAASVLPRPEDILFVDGSVYSWRAWDELSIADYYLGKYQESAEINQRLLAGSALPAGERPRILKNLEFAESKLTAK